MEPKTLKDIPSVIQDIRDDLARVKIEFGRRIVGNEEILGFIIKALLSNGHVLLEGAPGLGKTLMIRTLSDILDLKFRRVQFTPDLMPADIIGTNIIVEDGEGGRHFRFEEGPVFTNILLADEINRASPKTQSAMLQAMEEHEATVFGKNHALDELFFTLATQNPIEMAGTYPLPEAQLDRFMFKLVVPFPTEENLKRIGRLNVNGPGPGKKVKTVLSRQRIIDMRKAVIDIPITDRIYDFVVQLIHKTHPGKVGAPESVSRFIRYGASPRGLNAIIWAARISAVMDGRVNISIDDIEENYIPALRHRLVMRFEGEIEGISSDRVLEEIFRSVRKQF
ncbi:MAG: AAA family ATPase [bacterium]|nr:AAA family ATPase [bacterium]MDT8366908.1 AAA family ATPase [bacterium]